MTILVRPAEFSDIDQIRHVLTKTFLDTFPNQDFKITKEDILDDLKMIASEEVVRMNIRDAKEISNKRIFLVAIVNNVVVGIIECKKKEEVGKVIGLFVLPEFQGKGVGSALLTESFNFFGKDLPVLLTVESYNLKARDFYIKHGFYETGVFYSSHKTKSGACIPETEMACGAGKFRA